MLKLLVSAAFGVAFVLASSGSAHALSLSLQAAPPAITSIGHTVLVDLNVSGVQGSGGGTLRGYDIVIHFDPNVLSLGSDGITLNLLPFGGNSNVVLDSSVMGGNSASLAIFVSLVDPDGVSDAALRLLQTDAFPLAQLSFTSVIVPAQTTISFGEFDVLTGLDSSMDPSSGVRAHSSIDLVLVPEPGAATLVALGFAGLTAMRRRCAR